MHDRLVMFADDRQAALRQQMMHIGDAACHRIFDRDHRKIGGALLHRAERIVEGQAGQRRGIREHRSAGKIRISAGGALEGDGFGHSLILLCFNKSDTVPLPLRESYRSSSLHFLINTRLTLSKSSIVSTPIGTASIIPTSICMPRLRARSCSRLSRTSTGDTGATA